MKHLLKKIFTIFVILIISVKRAYQFQCIQNCELRNRNQIYTLKRKINEMSRIGMKNMNEMENEIQVIKRSNPFYISVTKHWHRFRYKKKNNLYVLERSVDKVTGHFMKDKDLFLEVDKKKKIIEELEQLKTLDYEQVKKYLDILSENDVYEEVINHKIHLYTKFNETEKKQNIVKLQHFLNPYIINTRKKKAKEKVEYLLSRIIMGDPDTDNIITEMIKKKYIDTYVLTFIEDKIMEAHTKHGKSTHLNNEMSLSEKVLRTLKDRIIAQIKLNEKGTFDFTRILFLSTTLSEEGNREPLIKSFIKSIEQLEEFELYLLDALEYAEENPQMKKYVTHLEILLNTCKKMNPVNQQFLNKQTDNIRFKPNDVDTSHLKEL